MRNRVLGATGQDPCARVPAPDFYTGFYSGSAAPRARRSGAVLLGLATISRIVFRRIAGFPAYARHD